jgi:hypothetical protein
MSTLSTVHTMWDDQTHSSRAASPSLVKFGLAVCRFPLFLHDFLHYRGTIKIIICWVKTFLPVFALNQKITLFGPLLWCLVPLGDEALVLCSADCLPIEHVRIPSNTHADSSAHAQDGFVWQGFDYRWERELAGFNTPHRLGTWTSYVRSSDNSLVATFTPGTFSL